MAAKATSKGGGRMSKVLADIAHKMGEDHVRVGFLETATYPPFRTRGYGKNRKTVPAPPHPVAQVAFWNEFGTATAPPRPFFRNMIKAESPRWGERMARSAKARKYNGRAVLEDMGQGISGQLRQSIIDTNTPPNAARTVEMKNGASKPLVDEGVMLGSVSYEVATGETE